MRSQRLFLGSSVMALFLWAMALAANEEANVSVDIRDQITEKDLRAARAALEPYFLEELPDPLELVYALATGEYRVLVVEFDLQDSRYGDGARYTIHVVSKLESPTWQLSQINVRSQRSLPGHDDPVLIQGAVDSGTLDEVVDHVTRFWSKSRAGSMKVVHVASNLLPPLRSAPEPLRGKTPNEVYSVGVEGLEPLAPPEPSGATIAIASNAGSRFSVRLERDENDDFVVTEVHSSGYPPNDTGRLDLLRQNIERPIDAQERESRRSAARAVLPDDLRNAHLDVAWITLNGQNDHMVFQNFDVQGPGNGRMFSVNCTRVSGTDEPWQCVYQDMSSFLK